MLKWHMQSHLGYKSNADLDQLKAFLSNLRLKHNPECSKISQL